MEYFMLISKWLRLVYNELCYVEYRGSTLVDIVSGYPIRGMVSLKLDGEVSNRNRRQKVAMMKIRRLTIRPLKRKSLRKRKKKNQAMKMISQFAGKNAQPS